MKKIPLTNSDKFALVDDDDFDEVSRYGWFLDGNGYVVVSLYCKLAKRSIRVEMARLIMRTPPLLTADHIHGNRLDNRKTEIRNCTRSQNRMNSIGMRKKHGLYKGTAWSKYIGKWCARIGMDKETIIIGYFDTELDAALAYNRKAKELFGDFARLNEI